jgi:hypothetical protein
MKNILIALCLSVLWWSLPASSHHAATTHYDLSKLTSVEGVVTEYRMINPHARIYLDVTTESGQVQSWMAEGEASSVLLRRGWTGEEFMPGDTIKITGNPSREGLLMMEWRSIILPDGREIKGGNAQPTVDNPEQSSFYQELEKKRRAAREQERSN